MMVFVIIITTKNVILQLQEWFLENKITWVTMLAILAAVQVGHINTFMHLRVYASMYSCSTGSQICLHIHGT